MFSMAVNKILVGYILMFYTVLGATTVAHGDDIINQVLSELSELKFKVNECGEKLAKMEHRDQSRDDKLWMEFAKMEERVITAQHKQKSTEEVYKKKIAKMESKLLVSENKLKYFEKINERLEEMDNRLMIFENDHLKILSQTHLAKRLLGPAITHRVAFSAYLSQSANAITELGREHTIPFDKVLLNEGQAFDTMLHVFTCPVNGIYTFKSALMSDHYHMIQTELVKNGTPLVRMYADGSTGGDGYDQAFNSVNIQCNNGERVWVRVHEHYGSSLFTWQFASFSGHILWEI